MGQREKRTFGVELEYLFPLDNRFESAVVKAAKTTGHKVRSSCRVNGCTSLNRSKDPVEKIWRAIPEDSAISEVTTPAFSRIEDLRAGMDVLMKELATIRSLENGPLSRNCGCHVHISVEDIQRDPNKVVKLVQFFSLAEKYFFQLQPVFRGASNQWCRPIKDIIKRVLADKDTFWRKWKDGGKEESLIMGGRDGKRKRSWDWYDILEYWDELEVLFEKDTSMSLGSLTDYKTVEIRIGASSLSAEDITNWTQICVGYVDKCIQLIKKGKSKPRFTTFNGFLRFMKASPDLSKWAHRQREKY